MMPAKTVYIVVRRKDNGVELGVFPRSHQYLSLMIGDHIFSGHLRFRVIERTWARSQDFDTILRIEVVPEDERPRGTKYKAMAQASMLARNELTGRAHIIREVDGLWYVEPTQNLPGMFPDECEEPGCSRRRSGASTHCLRHQEHNLVSKAAAPDYARCEMGTGCKEAGSCFAAGVGEPGRCDAPKAAALLSESSRPGVERAVSLLQADILIGCADVLHVDVAAKIRQVIDVLTAAPAMDEDDIPADQATPAREPRE